MAYGFRHQGLVLSRTGSPVIDGPFRWVEEIGRQLSERSCAAASAVAGSLSEDVLARLLLSDTLADATRLLEAPRLPPVTAEPANRRFEPPKPDDVTSAENMGATCRSEPPPTSRRTSANTATLDGSYRSLRLR
jgi:hypothetical protein